MKHKILGIVILVAALMTGGIAHAEHLVFSTFEGYPMVSETMRQVMVEAYERIGVTMELKRYPGERSIRTANEGKVDGELFRKKKGIEEAFPNLVRVPVCIHAMDLVVFTKDKDFHVDGWESLLPYTVGYKHGVKAIEMNVLKGTKIERVESMDLAFKKLAFGRTDLVIDAPIEGLATIEKLGLKNIRILEPPLFSVESYHYLHVKNKHLLEPLTEALQQMEREGLIKQIKQQVEKEFQQ